MTSNMLSYIGQRFWLPEEGRMINAGSISFSTKRVFEAYSSKSYIFTSKGKIIYIIPTFVFDMNNKMIYEHDIVKVNEDNYRVKFEDNEFWLMDNEDTKVYRLAAWCKYSKVVGNMFESANLITKESK